MSVWWLGLVAFYGACAGSYLGVVVDRLPAGRGLADGSCCGTCGHRLRAVDNVPALAYLWLRGRCRSCGTPIPAVWWLLEVVTAAAWTLVAALLGPGVWLVVALPAVWLVLLAAGLRFAGRPSVQATPPSRPLAAAGVSNWAAAALPAGALAAQVVALGAAVDERWKTFLLLGAVGTAGLVVAVLVAPRARPAQLPTAWPR